MRDGAGLESPAAPNRFARQFVGGKNSVRAVRRAAARTSAMRSVVPPWRGGECGIASFGADGSKLRPKPGQVFALRFTERLLGLVVHASIMCSEPPTVIAQASTMPAAVESAGTRIA